MSGARPLVALLPPQRFHPCLAEVVAALRLEGRLATVTAGWQEREGEDRELDQHLSGRTLNLRLYARVESVFERDPELLRAHRRRQEDLRHMQALYRLRLAGLEDTLRLLLEREGDSRFLEPERAAAQEAIRTLDAAHLERVRAIHAEFDALFVPGERAAWAREREQVAAELASCAGLLVAGGHVAVLLNRLRLLGVVRAAAGRPLIAWSAGAMAVADRVVLFHDFPPQGAGNPEILDVGLGLAPGVVALPHARRRLDLEDRLRVRVLARRFAPAACLPMDMGGPVLLWDGGAWSAAGGARVLAPSGEVRLQERWAA